MQSLQYIKKRIKSVQTTSKITGAMKLIAVANIRKQTKEYYKIASFCKDFYHTIKPLITTTSEVPLVNKGNDKTLYILISSSLGLCGAFNINVSKYLIERLNSQDKVIVIGKKSFSYLKSRGLTNQIKSVVEVSNKNPSYLEILPMSGIIMESFFNNEFGKVKIVYTKFLNSMSFEPTEVPILPLDKTLFQNDESNKKFITSYDSLNDKNQLIEYDSPKHQILRSVLPSFITTIIYAAIIESSLCESCSRRNAMDTATKNAKELINNLILNFNQVRQEKITQEINEIVAGGAANE